MILKNHIGNEQVVRKDLLSYYDKKQLAEIAHQVLDTTFSDSTRVVYSHYSNDEINKISQYNPSTEKLASLQKLEYQNGNIIKRQYEVTNSDVKHLETFTFDDNPSFKYCNPHFMHNGENLSLNNITRKQIEVLVF